MPEFLSQRKYRWATLLLLVQIAAFYGYPKAERRPLGRPLTTIPVDYMGWHMVAESRLDTEVQALLKADETVNRVYTDDQGNPASLFVAFFQTQRTGVAPHSPKVCLPGSGWVPLDSTRINIDVPGEPDPIRVNKYVVGKGESRSLVLYWYQTPYRVIASEYLAKYYTIIDGVRYLRSDTSLVRVIVNATEETLPQAELRAVKFTQDFFPKLKEHLPRQ